VGLCSVSGCFFAPLPLPDDPEAERPNLNLNGAVPPVSQVLAAERGITINFTVPFTSVDAGQYVWWWLWANWDLASMPELPETKGRLSPRPPSIDSGMGGETSMERSIIFSWTPDASTKPGCSQLTLLVTHAENADLVADRPFDVSQAAIATYWVNVDAPLAPGQTLDCPPPAVLPP